MNKKNIGTGQTNRPMEYKDPRNSHTHITIMDERYDIISEWGKRWWRVAEQATPKYMTSASGLLGSRCK